MSTPLYQTYFNNKPLFFHFKLSVFRLESPDLPLREHLAHTVPDEQIIQIDDQLTTINMDNFLTVHSTEKSTVRTFLELLRIKCILN